MKKLWIILVIILGYGLSQNNAYGQQAVSKNEAIAVASYYLSVESGDPKSHAISQIDTVFEWKEGRVTVIFEVVFKNGNSALLSASKACRPILGYNISGIRESIFDSRNVPDGLMDILGEHIEIIVYALSLPNNDTLIVNSEYAKEWIGLLNPKSSRATKATTYGPLTTSEWGQSEANNGSDCNAYNYYVTETGSGCTCSPKKCPTGCVATAMAQIMYYWKYPMSMGPFSSFYDWCNMTDELNVYSSNYINERNAIAKLMRDCGNEINSNYCSSGDCQSSAGVLKARNKMVSSFGFSSDADWQLKSSHNNNTWIGRIKNNINNNWPVLYSGNRTLTAGHAFICDGYKTNNTFHFNWGWNGWYQNTWLALDNLTPVSGYNYKKFQGAVFYLYPGGTENACNNVLYLDIFYPQYSILVTPSFIPWLTVPNNYQTLISASYPNSPTIYYTIPPGATSRYEAHKEIKLLPGFQALSGSNFTAKIKPCQICPNNKSLSVLQVQNESDHSNIDIENLGNEMSPKYEIDALKPKNTIKIYPNPTNDIINIEIPNLEENTKLNLYNLNGQLVLTESILKNKTQLDLTTLNSGIYFLRVTSQKTNEVIKVIKK